MSEGIKSVSWKFDKLSDNDKEKIRLFIKSQKNTQNTLNFLAIHFLERFGEVDIMDFEVQRQLFADLDSKISIDTKESKIVHANDNKTTKTISKHEIEEKNNKKQFDLANNVNKDDF